MSHAASTRASATGARCSSCPNTASPRSAPGSWTSRTPPTKMSTTGGTEQGTVLVLGREARQAITRPSSSRAVTDSGSEIRRAPEKPGITNLIEILAVVLRRAHSRPRQVEAEQARRARVRRLQGSGRRRHGRAPRARCASATSGCAPTRTRSRRKVLADGAERKARAIAAPRRSPTYATAWASASPVGRERLR